LPGFFVIFLLVVLACLGLCLYALRYLAARRRLTYLRIALTVVELGGVGLLYYLFRTHQTEGWAGMVTLPIILLLVGQLIALGFVVFAVVVRALRRRIEAVPYNAERRRVLKNAALYPAAGFLLSSYGAFIERHQTVRRDYTIPIANLPHEADGMVIAQISDVHLGTCFGWRV